MTTTAYTQNRTPGPWRAIEWRCHAATTVVIDDSTTATGKRVIAECETTEGDARLIAAAPDLLEALIEVLATNRATARVPETTMKAELMLDRIRMAAAKAEAAIAKAKGGAA